MHFIHTNRSYIMHTCRSYIQRRHTHRSCMHTDLQDTSFHATSMHTYLRVCMYVYIYVHTYIYVFVISQANLSILLSPHASLFAWRVCANPRSLMLPRSVAVPQCHLGWRTLLKCNKTNHACLPACIVTSTVT